jgi:hypothetical protein
MYRSVLPPKRSVLVFSDSFLIACGHFIIEVTCLFSYSFFGILDLSKYNYPSHYFSHAEYLVSRIVLDLSKIAAVHIST